MARAASMGHARDRLPGVMGCDLVGSERVDDHEVQVGPQEGEVVVAAVPDDDVRLGLRLLEDRRVVDAGEDDAAGLQVGLVLLALLVGAAGLLEIRAAGEALHPLGGEVAIGHRVP
jgi:hypothetical protein